MTAGLKSDHMDHMDIMINVLRMISASTQRTHTQDNKMAEAI